MDDKKEQVFEIAKDLCECYGGYFNYESCGFCFGIKDNFIGCKAVADKLYEIGYRKQQKKE